MDTNNSRGAAVPRGKPFQKGQSGNPSGRPKIPKSVIEAARAHTEKAINTLVTILNSKKATASAKVSAAIAILNRGWGQPVQPTEMEVRGQLDTTVTEVPRPQVSPEQWLKAHGVDLKEIADGVGPAARATNERTTG